MLAKDTGGSTVTISQANLTGAAFSVSGLTLPLNLTANQSVTFTVTFAPTSAGAVSGSLSVVSNASNSPAHYRALRDRNRRGPVGRVSHQPQLWQRGRRVKFSAQRQPDRQRRFGHGYIGKSYQR